MYLKNYVIVTKKYEKPKENMINKQSMSSITIVFLKAWCTIIN